jgi:hypothetical protein
MHRFSLSQHMKSPVMQPSGFNEKLLEYWHMQQSAGHLCRIQFRIQFALCHASGEQLLINRAD